MGQHDEHEQDVEQHRWHREEVDGHQRIHVVLQKRTPGLRGRLAPARQVLGDGGLGNADAELEQFAVDARRAPPVGRGHALDESADLGIDAGTTALGPATPSRVPTKPCSMPPVDGGGLDDDQGVAPAGPPSIDRWVRRRRRRRRRGSRSPAHGADRARFTSRSAPRHRGTTPASRTSRPRSCARKAGRVI